MGNNQSVFYRGINIFVNLFWFVKNDLSLARKIKKDFNLLGFLVILGILGLLLAVFLRSVWWIMVIAILVILILELIIFSVITWRSKIYRLQTITIKDNSIEILYRGQTLRENIDFQNINKLSYAGGYTYLMTGGSLFYWLRHYEIDYVDNHGQNAKLLVPLDISRLAEFLAVVIQKAGLTKVMPNKLAVFYEWQKNPNQDQATKEQNISPFTVNPNAKIGKIVLLALVFWAIIYAVWWYFFR